MFLKAQALIVRAGRWHQVFTLCHGARSVHGRQSKGASARQLLPPIPFQITNRSKVQPHP